jgi:pimeloyl-ACP methyl ester carboxylesterase
MARRVLAHAPAGRFALCGLSMGGYVAMEIMRQASERVARLALFDTQAIPETPEATQRRLTQMRLAKGGKLALVVESLLPLELYGQQLEDSRLRDLRKAMALSPRGTRKWRRRSEARRSSCSPDAAICLRWKNPSK